MKIHLWEMKNCLRRWLGIGCYGNWLTGDWLLWELNDWGLAVKRTFWLGIGHFGNRLTGDWTLLEAPQTLTLALIGWISCGSSPGPVLVERLTILAIRACRMMLAGTCHFAMLPLHALTGVTVAFTPGPTQGESLCHSAAAMLIAHGWHGHDPGTLPKNNLLESVVVQG